MLPLVKMISAGAAFGVAGPKPNTKSNSRVEMSFMIFSSRGFAVWKGGVYLTETDEAKFLFFGVRRLLAVFKALTSQRTPNYLLVVKLIFSFPLRPLRRPRFLLSGFNARRLVYPQR